MKKEFLIIVSISLILTILIHYTEFLEHPIEHIKLLSSSSAYGFGSFHPIIFTLIIYILLWIPRLILQLFIRKLK